MILKRNYRYYNCNLKKKKKKLSFYTKVNDVMSLDPQFFFFLAKL